MNKLQVHSLKCDLRGIQNCTDTSPNRTRDKVVQKFALRSLRQNRRSLVSRSFEKGWVTHLGLWQHRLHLIDTPEVPTVPVDVSRRMGNRRRQYLFILPPECGFHTGVKTNQAFLSNDLLHDVRWSFVSTCFVLESGLWNASMLKVGNKVVANDPLDLNKLKRYDDETFLATEVNWKLVGVNDGPELTLAPALQPVRTDSPWVIFDSPERLRNVLPQKSLEALSNRKTRINWAVFWRMRTIWQLALGLQGVEVEEGLGSKNLKEDPRRAKFRTSIETTDTTMLDEQPREVRIYEPHPSTLMIFLNDPIRPYSALPLSSCIRVLTFSKIKYGFIDKVQ